MKLELKIVISGDNEQHTESLKSEIDRSLPMMIEYFRKLYPELKIELYIDCSDDLITVKEG